MAEYAEIIQNLEDAGCDEMMREQFAALGDKGERQSQIKLLEKHRKNLLGKLHNNEKQIDCLDYLVYKMKKIK